MIQFNLLPDVKIEFIKTRRQRRLVILSALAVGGVSLFIVFSLFLMVNVLQRQTLNDLKRDVERDTKTLKETPDLAKILTIQNQLRSLPDLHSSKPVAARIFGYLSQLTPLKVTISNFEVDFDTKKVTITGAADLLSTVNQFVDTLKFTSYEDKDADKKGMSFPNVVLVAFGRDVRGVSYQISLDYDPIIFDSANEIALVVPKTITTRSENSKTEELFKQLSGPKPTQPTDQADPDTNDLSNMDEEAQ